MNLVSILQLSASDIKQKKTPQPPAGILGWPFSYANIWQSHSTLSAAHLPVIHGPSFSVRHAEFPGGNRSVLHIRQCPPGKSPVILVLVRGQYTIAHRRPERQRKRPWITTVTRNTTVNIYFQIKFWGGERGGVLRGSDTDCLRSHQSRPQSLMRALQKVWSS